MVIHFLILDTQHVNVTLGDVTFAYHFNYEVVNGTSKKTGSALGHVLADQTSYFIKRLMIIDGYLEWDLVDIGLISITYPTTVESSTPTLTYDEKTTIELILNDHSGDRKLRSEILLEFNTNYKPLLREHLNKE